MKKVFCIIFLAFTFLAFSTPALAASANGAADINDLMGQRPGNSYYQNPSSSSQTQGTADVLNSAGTSVLQQPASGELKVIGPPVTVTPATATESSNWKVLAILAAIFFAAAIALLAMTLSARKSVKQIVDYGLPKVKAAVTKKPEVKSKKVTAKKKSSNKKHSPRNRR